VVPFRPCLLHNNSATDLVQIRHKPKWITHLQKTTFDPITGEIKAETEYLTDDLTAGNNRKIKAVNTFVGKFENAYRRREVSMLMVTLTIANKTGISISQAMETLKKRITRNGHFFYGYFWVLEVSDRRHIHYHAIVVTSRINCKGKALPSFLKLTNYWGARAKTEFIQKGVKYYLGRYFTKNKSRITGKRLFGQSITGDAPIQRLPVKGVKVKIKGKLKNRHYPGQVSPMTPMITDAVLMSKDGDRWEVILMRKTPKQHRKKQDERLKKLFHFSPN